MPYFAEVNSGGLHVVLGSWPGWKKLRKIMAYGEGTNNLRLHVEESQGSYEKGLVSDTISRKSLTCP